MITRQADTNQLELAFQEMLYAYQTGNDEQVQLNLSNFETLLIEFLDETNIKNSSQLYMGKILIRELTDSFRIGSTQRIN